MNLKFRPDAHVPKDELERVAFERWATEKHLLMERCGHGYYEHATQTAWAAWLARARPLL